MRISDGMSTDVEIVSLDAAPTPVTRFVVVLDDLGEPLHLMETGSAQRCPAVIAHHEISLAEICDGDAITLMDLDPPGIVVTDDDRQVVGVLPVDILDDFTARHMFPDRPMSGSDPSDSGLGGDIRLPLARVRCAQPDCGFVNEVARYDRRALPPCQNRDVEPHRLRKE